MPSKTKNLVENKLINFSLPFRIGPPELHFYSSDLIVKKKDGEIIPQGTLFPVYCNYTLAFSVIF